MNKQVINEPPTVEEIGILQMLGGIFTDMEYVRENLVTLRANHLGDGVYGFAYYPMARPRKASKKRRNYNMKVHLNEMLDGGVE